MVCSSGSTRYMKDKPGRCSTRCCVTLRPAVARPSGRENSSIRMRISDRNGNDYVHVDCRGQGLSLGLIVGQRHGLKVLDCRVVLGSSGALVFTFEGNTPPV